MRGLYRGDLTDARQPARNARHEIGAMRTEYNININILDAEIFRIAPLDFLHLAEQAGRIGIHDLDRRQRRAAWLILHSRDGRGWGRRLSRFCGFRRAGLPGFGSTCPTSSPWAACNIRDVRKL